PAPANPLAPAPGGLLLNQDQAAAWRALPPRPASPLASNQPPQTCYKLVVDQDGMYRVTRAELAAAGMPVDTVDPRTFRLTSQGRDIAISVTGESDGVFNAGDELRFYGQRYATKVISDTFIENGALVTRPSAMSAYYSDATSYTDENVYWLTAGGAPGPRMAAVDAAPLSGAPVAPSYRELVRAEQSYRWYSTQFLSRDKWMWGRLNLPIAGGGPATFTATASLSALAPAGGPARVRAEIQSLLQGAGDDDHHTSFALLGPGDVRTVLEDATWDGISIHQLNTDAPRSALREGTNYLELTAYLQPGMTAEQLFFNWFEIEYDRRFEAAGNVLRWPGRAGSWNYQVTGFSAADLLAFDVSDPLLPRQLANGVVTPSGGGQQIALGIAGAADRRYLAVSAAAMRAPKRLSAYTPPDLRAASNGADYIFITHADFLTATQALASYRAGQGMRTMVVDAEDVYNEFNDGIFHPVAFKRFLAYAYATWQGAPVSYALLVGDGHWNLKNFAPPPAGPLPPGQPPYTDYRAGPVFMPPLLAWVDPYQGEVDSTNLLAAFVGEDIFPDVSIGRLPVNTPAQAQAAVAKTIAFEQAPAAGWQRRMLFVADNTPDPAGDFVQLSEEIINDHLPAGWAADRIYLDDVCGPPSNQLPSCPAMNQQIISTLNTTGTLFLNYTGHASLNRWAAEQIFVNANVPALANGDKLPIVLSMTCLDGYWLYPNLPGMMEEMVRADSRGAVAAFSPTGLGVASGHDIM
ncbi:MAG TPA: C25 family cysteine peptidase, partial [Herpetosiphonaceae bacterium]